MPITKINKRFVPTDLDNANLAAGAAIDTSKLADGANFVKKDGTVAYTGDQSMGNNKLTNVATPAATTDAANKAYVDGAVAGINQLFKSKQSARASATGNVTIANPGTAVFDGVTLISGDRLLLRSQTAPAENGIYIFATSATALVRSTDADTWAEIAAALVTVEEGSTGADTMWLCTSNTTGGTLGTTAITWQQTNAAGLATSNFVKKETPSGVINGSNTAFTLANTPVAGTEEVYVNGLLMTSGASNDYTITASTITLSFAPVAGEVVRASYMK